ncbi:DUF4302 domain-containing protein [Terrimonas ferruginea]|uniref:DUF4302 domain-containing protein n=1 Tax=Terrimonas ferruginea TaxID=249 RepID=UPI0004295F83|nr:DUF4302 domain-containing protein [Terrimonas ferruginea]
MKNYITVLILLLSLTACRRDFDETIFGETPDARLTKTLDSLQSRLAGEPGGWTGFLTTGTGLRAGFYFKFTQNNRVSMVSDVVTGGDMVKESSYRLKALQQPCLIFDTYSYLHILADPNGDVNGGTDGAGLQSDFEFAYDPSADNKDSIVLIGRMHNSRLVLRPGTRTDGDAFDAGGLSNAQVFDSLPKRYLNYFKRFTLGGNTYELVVNRRKKSLKVAWMEGAVYKEAMSYYMTTPSGNVQLISPVDANGVRISVFTDMRWDNAAVSLSFAINGERVTPVGFTRPLQVDLTAPRRWWQTSKDEDTYWVSATGFRVNGVDDAYGVSRLAGYTALMYGAEWGTVRGTTTDCFGYIRNRTQLFAPAVVSPPSFGNDGRVMFTRVLGASGDPATFSFFGTNPGQAAINTFFPAVTKLADAQGYIAVQIYDTYDLVDPVNATSWVSWER